MVIMLDIDIYQSLRSWPLEIRLDNLDIFWSFCHSILCKERISRLSLKLELIMGTHMYENLVKILDKANYIDKA